MLLQYVKWEAHQYYYLAEATLPQPTTCDTKRVTVTSVRTFNYVVLLLLTVASRAKSRPMNWFLPFLVHTWQLNAHPLSIPSLSSLLPSLSLSLPVYSYFHTTLYISSLPPFIAYIYIYLYISVLFPTFLSYCYVCWLTWPLLCSSSFSAHFPSLSNVPSWYPYILVAFLGITYLPPSFTLPFASLKSSPFPPFHPETPLFVSLIWSCPSHRPRLGPVALL